MLFYTLWKSDVTSRDHIARTSLKSLSHPRIASRPVVLWRNPRVMAMENARIRTMSVNHDHSNTEEIRVCQRVTSWLLQRIVLRSILYSIEEYSVVIIILIKIQWFISMCVTYQEMAGNSISKSLFNAIFIPCLIRDYGGQNLKWYFREHIYFKLCLSNTLEMEPK